MYTLTLLVYSFVSRFLRCFSWIKEQCNRAIQPQAQQVELDLDVNGYRCLAQVSEYNISTNRAQIDITHLGDEFKQNYANGLISGQGSLTCFGTTSIAFVIRMCRR